MTKTTIMHFKVCGEGITRLIRDIYLYENKEKAWNIIGTMHGITINQSKAVFYGDAEFINDKKDDSIVLLVYKENKEWKKTFDDHIKFLEEREKRSRFITENARLLAIDYEDMTEIEAKDWIIRAEPLSKNSTRSIITIAKELILKNISAKNTKKDNQREKVYDTLPISEETQKKADLDIAKKIFISNVSETDKEQKKVNEELMKKFAGKLYSFDFKGVSYTFKDSARNQGQCPHCDNQASDGFFWKETDEGYIGYYDFKQGEVAVCFECPECFETFYYHYNKNDFLRRLKKQ